MISDEDFKNESIQIFVESTEYTDLAISIEEYNHSFFMRQAIGIKSNLIYKYSLNFQGRPYTTKLYLGKSEYKYNRDRLLHSAHQRARSECLEYFEKLDRGETKDRLYWFGRNLLAFALVITLSPVYWSWRIIYSTFGALVTLTVTDGSEVIGFPNDWEWLDGK